MDTETLEALVSYLGTLMHPGKDGEPDVVGCDNTLNKTALWLLAEGRDVAADLAWLQEQGGCCDCEVIVNVYLPTQEG